MNESPCYRTNVARALGALNDIYDENMNVPGLSISQYQLIVNLQRLGHANTTEWSEYAGLNRSTMVRNVRTLEKNGWVEVVEGGPGKQFALTAAGVRTLEEARPGWQKTQDAIVRYLGRDDATALIRICRKLQQGKEVL